MRYAVLPSRSPVLTQQSSLTPVLTPQSRKVRSIGQCDTPPTAKQHSNIEIKAKDK